MKNPTKVADSLEKFVINHDKKPETQQSLNEKLENLIDLLEILIDLNEKSKNLSK